MKWIDVEDKLPEDKTIATLVLRQNNPWPTTRFYIGGGLWKTRDTVLYWMPLPPPPLPKEIE